MFPTDHVLSIRDIPYQIVPNTAFHPLLLEGAISRIRKEFQLPNVQQELDQILEIIFKNPKLKHVWALIFEYRQEPIYVVRNLLHTNTTLLYRRVLVVNLDDYLLNQDTNAQPDQFMEHSAM
jgi:hypothetical protein